MSDKKIDFDQLYAELTTVIDTHRGDNSDGRIALIAKALYYSMLDVCVDKDDLDRSIYRIKTTIQKFDPILEQLDISRNKKNPYDHFIEALKNKSKERTW